jgi:hypothetical protein
VQNIKGKTAIDYAREKGNQEIVAIFESELQKNGVKEKKKKSGTKAGKTDRYSCICC